MLEEYCLNLKCPIKHNENLDIDGLDLFTKLTILKDILQAQYDTSTDVFFKCKYCL